MSIIINILVTQIILFEKPSKEEWVAILYVIFGCFLAISVTPDHDSGLPIPQLIQRPISYVYIVMNWIVFILFYLVLENITLPKSIQRFGYPFIAGALGAQNVCMGKYIAYGVSTIQDGCLTLRPDNFCAAIILCLASIIIHVIWLNKGLEKYDAYFCIIIYQTAWFMFTTISGIVVYDDMSVLSTTEQLIFAMGLITAIYGVKRISVVHKETTPDESPSDEP
tara:strand:+ start:5161 stop:5829 length:669 start_codon:yes stop_codon:yes gene_type:complete